MSFLSLTANLMVKDVDKTIDFYNTILGFSTFDTVFQGKDLVWGMIKKDNVYIMLQKFESIIDEYPSLKKQEFGGGLTLYITVQDVDNLYKDIKDTVTIVRELHKTPYGANEFAILDPNNFILVFSNILE